ncbi:unnamed protein product [Amoebophrya sp. A25]|nr:unnamed protein product [Amoebophrya sp. A25]|eukprot:GSA25T00020688001.1
MTSSNRKRVVFCVGDSHTQGCINKSANYVDLLTAALSSSKSSSIADCSSQETGSSQEKGHSAVTHAVVLSHGINGQRTWEIGDRIGAGIRETCADDVVLLAGTNDCLRHLWQEVHNSSMLQRQRQREDVAKDAVDARKTPENNIEAFATDYRDCLWEAVIALDDVKGKKR